MRTKLGERNHGDSSGRFRIFPNSPSSGSISIRWTGLGAGCGAGLAIFGGGKVWTELRRVEDSRPGGDFGFFVVRAFWILAWDVPFGALFEPGTIALEAPHAVLGPGLQRGNYLKEVAVADEVLDGVVGHEDFTLGTRIFNSAKNAGAGR